MDKNVLYDKVCPTWCNYASLLKDENVKDAVIVFAACLSAVKEELHSLSEGGQKAAIESAGYIAWKAIGGDPEKKKCKTDDGWTRIL